MGTRGLTCVVLNGEYKVAQYGQWGHNYSGQGLVALEFLRDQMDLDKFKRKVAALEEASDSYLNEKWVECGARHGAETVSLEAFEQFGMKFPHLSRDCGADILSFIQESDVKLVRRNLEFASDSLFCECAYIVDLDKMTFEVYDGFQKEPHTGERFSNFPSKDTSSGTYYPVKLNTSFDLDDLPTNKGFIAILEGTPLEQLAEGTKDIQ